MEKNKIRLHNRACKTLGIGGDKIRLVSPGEYKELTGHGVSNYLGIAANKLPIYYVRRNQPLTSYVHEILHLLFRSKPHWWIYATAWKLTPGHSDRNACYGFGRGCTVSSDDIERLPSKGHIIELSQQSYNRI